jgi:hypothetical protein
MADIFYDIAILIFCSFFALFAQNPAEKVIFQKSEDFTL